MDGDDFVWVTNAKFPDRKGLPSIEKRDKEGKLIWRKSLPIVTSLTGFPFYKCEFNRLTLVNNQYFLQGWYLSDDWPPFFFILILDNEGDILNH